VKLKKGGSKFSELNGLTSFASSTVFKIALPGDVTNQFVMDAAVAPVGVVAFAA
jgi:hypothetical protein